MNRFLAAVIVVSVLVFSGSAAYAHSDGLLLNFNRVGDMQPVGNLYSGYGISFSSNVFGLRSYQQQISLGNGNFTTGNGAFSRDPTGSPAIFVMGANGSTATGIMNVSNGFSGGIQFFYTAGFSETVTVWSGTNGTGTVLAVIALTANNGNCPGFPTYCNWSSIGANFSGTAKSVTVTGPADGMGISDITLGAPSTAVPEPSTFYLLGTGLVGVSLNRLRRIWKR
jgi:hypothetical protein